MKKRTCVCILIAVAVANVLFLLYLRHALQPITPAVAKKLLGADENEIVRVLGEPKGIMGHDSPPPPTGGGEDLMNMWREYVREEVVVRYHYNNGTIYVSGEGKVVGVFRPGHDEYVSVDALRFGREPQELRDYYKASGMRWGQ